MLLQPKFFYDDNAAEQSGGSIETKEEVVENKQEEIKVDAPPAPAELPAEIQAQLKELEELRAYKAANPKAAPAKTKEEIEKEEQLEKVNFRKFAVEQDLAKDDDFIKYETLQQKKDADLVFEDFATQYKTDNPDADPDTLDEDIKAAFNEQYHLDSENKTLKSRGQKLIEKEAKDLRSPYDSKITAAKGRYDSEKEKVKSEAQLKETFETKYIPFSADVKKAIPAKLTYSTVPAGEDKVNIEVDVTAEDIEEVEKKFLQTHKTFQKFIDGKPEEVQQEVLNKITNYLLTKKRDEGNTKLAEAFEAIGVKKGSNVGADNPFALSGKVIKMDENETLEESNARLAKARANAQR